MYLVNLLSHSIQLPADLQVDIPAGLQPQSFKPAATWNDLDKDDLAKSLNELAEDHETPFFSAAANDLVFCLSTGSTISVETTLDQYLGYTGQQGKKESKDPINVYVLKITRPPSYKTLEELANDESAVVTFELVGKPVAASADGKPAPANKQSSHGLSELLTMCAGDQKIPASDVTMAHVKTAMTKLGLGENLNIWKGTTSTLLDEGLKFEAYCGMLWNEDKSKSGKVMIYYGLKKDHVEQSASSVYQAGKFMVKFMKVGNDNKLSPVGSVRVIPKTKDDKAADALDYEKVKSFALGHFRRHIATMSQLAKKHEFCWPDATPVMDSMLFSDYAASLNEPCQFDDALQSIKLRFKETENNNFTGGDVAKAALAEIMKDPKLVAADIPASLISHTSAWMDDKMKNLIDLNKFVMDGTQATVNSPSELDELQWALVIKNCQVMHGWYFDDNTKQIKMAPRPAFKLRPGLNIADAEKYDAKGDPDKKLNRLLKPEAIPTFLVEDGTKIDVQTVDTETRQSLVENNFDKMSAELKVTAGYAGVGVGVEAARSTDQQEGHLTETKSYKRKMIGKYMMPRATLILRPEDMVATPELIEHAKAVEKLKDPIVLRDFYKSFGQFFSHEVTIGGQLISTKDVDSSETNTQEKTKEAFKNTIGLSVSTPWGVGVGGKYETVTGKDKDDVKGWRQVDDRVAFEAVGGNSILASDPQKWCATNGVFTNWRVIMRLDLRNIYHSIAQSKTTGLENISNWFFSTVPSTTTDLIETNSSREIFAQLRCKTASPDDKPQYLAHLYDLQVQPKIDNMKPPSFQGPRLAVFDAPRKWTAREGVWVIIARGDKHLVDGSKVTIQTSHEFNLKRYLNVLRASNRVFMPCVSSTGHEPIWTIRVAPGVGKALPAKPTDKDIKDNDTICLTFEFDDNRRGYRDFYNDDRGFRRRDYPTIADRRLILAQSLDSSTWKELQVLVMAEETIDDQRASRTIVLNGQKVEVEIAAFNLDQLASDGTDEAVDILLEDPTEIAKQEKEMKEKLKT